VPPVTGSGLLLPGAAEGERIGLLGGSFNPAHEGHLHISRLALDRLELDRVWWLVSPQNPLKAEAGMAPFSERLAAARAVAAGDPRITVTDIERQLDTRYSADTLKALKALCPRARLVWLMGADLLGQIDRWKGWRDLFRSVPVAIFARPTYSLRALDSRAARRFRRYRIDRSRAGALADMDPPAWVFLNTPLNWQSATRIRRRRS